MNAIKNIIEKASKLNGTVVLPEGMDPRVITAACACVDRKIATPVVLGTPAEIADAEAKAGLKLADRGIKTIDYTQGDKATRNSKPRISKRGTQRSRRSRPRSRRSLTSPQRRRRSARSAYTSAA